MTIVSINPYCIFLENMPFIDNKGCLRLCCKNKNPGTTPDLTIQNTPLKELYSHQLIQKARENMRNGVVPNGCTICTDVEAMPNAKSFRERQFNGVRDCAKEQNIDLDETIIQALDLRLGSTCNLICTMCHPTESSRWHSVADKFFHDVQGFTKEEAQKKKDQAHPKLLNWAENDQSWNNIFSGIDESLTYVYLAGGEPFYIKRFTDYLGRLTEVSPYALVSINTNATCKLSDLALQELSKTLNLKISIDGYGKYEEYQRSGTSWEQKVEVMDQYYNNFHVSSFDITVTSLTISSLPKLAYFLKTRYPNAKILVRPVVNRKGLEINAVPDEFRIETLQFLKNVKHDSDYVNIGQVINILESGFIDRKKELRKYVNFWDNLNKFSFEEVNKSLFNWIMQD